MRAPPLAGIVEGDPSPPLARRSFLCASVLAAGGTGDADALRWAWYGIGEAYDEEGRYLTAFDFDGDGTTDLASWHDSYIATDGSYVASDTDFWYGLH